MKVNDTKLGLDESMSLSNWRVWSSEVMRQVTENMTDAELFDDVMFYVGEEKLIVLPLAVPVNYANPNYKSTGYKKSGRNVETQI